jgi:hypothetical protein
MELHSKSSGKTLVTLSGIFGCGKTTYVMLRRIQEALCQDKEILASKPLHWSLLTANIGMWKPHFFRFRRKRMVQASGKEQSRRKCRGAALLQSPAHRAGRIPAKVSVNARASVTAGLAKEVEAVNQYAPVM